MWASAKGHPPLMQTSAEPYDKGGRREGPPEQATHGRC